MTTKKKRVVITGLGAVTPLGLNVKDTWSGLVAGSSGISEIKSFDSKGFPTRIAGEVKNFDFEKWKEQDGALKHATKSTFYAVQAADEAFRDSRLRSYALDPERFGIYFGAGDSGIDFEPFVETVCGSFSDSSEELVDKGRYLEKSLETMNPMRELEAQPFMTVTHLARRFDIRGPVSNCLTACAASSQAIGEAFEWIRRGEADIVMSGGAHSMIYPLGIAGFSLLTALSTRNDDPTTASRPFDKERDGFVMGEGAGVVILEELEHALKRKARIYGELVGYGSTADAYRLTDMDPEGDGAMRAMKMALEKGGLDASQVDYVSAHGTSTTVNDSVETKAIKSALGSYAQQTPVSSVKSMLGHMIAAAGGVELIVCLLAMREGKIPPTINYKTPDPVCDLDYVPNEVREKEVNVALSNSFGFGGQNICLSMKKFTSRVVIASPESLDDGC